MLGKVEGSRWGQRAGRRSAALWEMVREAPRRGKSPGTKKKGPRAYARGPRKKAAAYSPTWCGSTIGADGLNFPVRNGKGWAPSPWPPKIVGRGFARQRVYR